MGQSLGHSTMSAGPRTPGRSGHSNTPALVMGTRVPAIGRAGFSSVDPEVLK